MPRARPTYLQTAPDATFAIHDPAEPRRDGATGVLVCPPWGWDEVASYRSRRSWARRLAAAGHPTLRIDLPGTGNSAGSPREPGRVAAWIAAIAAGVEWLRGGGEAARVAVLGLGVGGLLARAAIADGVGFEELILWGAPATGRAFVRETRAFSRLQAWQADAGDEGADTLPEGAIEAGGFLLGAEAIAELQALDPALAAGSPLERALLLERDGIAVDQGVRERLELAGVEVAVGPGPGWAELVSHAERTQLPLATADRVGSWLADGERPGLSVAPGPGDSEPAETLLECEGSTVRESALLLPMSFGDAFAVLAEPADGEASDVVAVCLNAGAVRTIGPNRIWVETARRWAARGVRTLRIDLEGIGESDGTAPAEVGEFYLPKFEQQLSAVLDEVEARGLGSGFLLAGLCGGGYWAFREALRDPRVRVALLLNSGALRWDPGLIAEREARKVGRAVHLGSWRRLLRGEVSREKLRGLLRSLAVEAGRTMRRAGRRRGVGQLEEDLDRLRDRGVPLTMGFSEGEPLLEELRAGGIVDGLDRWPNVELASLPGSDHTLRPLWAQRAARDLLDRGLEGATRAGTDSRATGPDPDTEAPPAPRRRPR